MMDEKVDDVVVMDNVVDDVVNDMVDDMVMDEEKVDDVEPSEEVAEV